MPELLREGSRGEEVRRLQHNLNAALGKRFHVPENGVFGPRTKAAVLEFQRHFRLKKKDGLVGDETRDALATRLAIISGTIGINPNYRPRSLSFGLGKLQLDPALVAAFSSPYVPPPQAPTAKKSPWLFQAQPQLMLTPPPFLFHDPMKGPAPGFILSGAVSVGLVYRTAAEGPHWEFGLSPQFLFNTTNTPSDPKYTLQLQGSISYADPWARERFHSELFLQAVGIMNFAPYTAAVQVAPGFQISADIIEDRWNIFLQGTVASQWNLTNGQWMLVPGLTLGSTVQWEFPTHK